MQRCLYCERIRVQPRPPKTADLPDERVRLYKPAFSYTGMDFFEPLAVKHSKHTRTTQTRFKRYGVVFVCLTTRAVHLDLVGDLSTDSFLLALIRVIARSGKPKTIWTDNDTNFIGAERKLSILLKDLNQAKIENSLINKDVTLKFNSPSSPWMGGSWKSIVRIRKRSLKSVLKDRPVYEDSLRTFLIDVEFTLNNCPLLPLSDNINDLVALIPNHF